MKRRENTTRDRLPKWILWWLIPSMLCVTWDVIFLIMRPESLPGGSLSFLWPHYVKYLEIDHTVGDLNNHFYYAQAFMSLVEIVVGVVALIFNGLRRPLVAALLVFLSTSLTAAKTLLIFITEYVSGLENIGHNNFSDLFLLYIIPNGLWIIFPLLVMGSTGKRLLSRPGF